MVDLIFKVCAQACAYFHKWSKSCDKRLARLISYIHHTCEFKQNCFVGNTAQQFILGLIQFSDFAGDLEDSRSTSGGTLCRFGSHTFVPMSWMQETDFSFTQFHGSWDNFSWCSFTLGWYPSSWSVEFGCTSAQNQPCKIKGLSVQGNSSRRKIKPRFQPITTFLICIMLTAVLFSVGYHVPAFACRARGVPSRPRHVQSCSKNDEHLLNVGSQTVPSPRRGESKRGAASERTPLLCDTSPRRGWSGDGC